MVRGTLIALEKSSTTTLFEILKRDTARLLDCIVFCSSLPSDFPHARAVIRPIPSQFLVLCASWFDSPRCIYYRFEYLIRVLRCHDIHYLLLVTPGRLTHTSPGWLLVLVNGNATPFGHTPTPALPTLLAVGSHRSWIAFRGFDPYGLQFSTKYFYVGVGSSQLPRGHFYAMLCEVEGGQDLLLQLSFASREGHGHFLFEGGDLSEQGGVFHD